MEHRRFLSSQTYGFSFASAKPTRWKYLKIPITFSTAHLFFVEFPISWHSRPRDCLELWALLVKWEWLCSRLRAHYLLSKSKTPDISKNVNEWKKKWLLHLGNLAQTTKTFPNIILKITQHNQLLAKHKIIDLFRINQRTRTNMERLSGIKWTNIR